MNQQDFPARIKNQWFASSTATAHAEVALLRVAWIVHVGELPHGAVRPRDGDEWNAAFENLIVTKSGARPFDQARGGKASTLDRRAETTTTLINALADHPGATVPQLSRLIGSSAPCTCVRLGKLADMGLTCGPKCDARARWDLTPAGRAVAQASAPILDDTDKQLLTTLVLKPTRQLELVRRTGLCSLTVKRRLGLLIERGLAKQDAPRLPFSVTDAGRQALGRAAPQHEPWVNAAAISAAAAKDVRERVTVSDMTRIAKSRSASLGAQRAIEMARSNRSPAFNPSWGRVRTG